MADLEQLKQKYNPVISTINSFAEFGAKLEAVDLAGEQLHIRATVPSKVIANRVWDAIKQVDPSYADLKHEIGTTGGDTQPYTINPATICPRSASSFTVRLISIPRSPRPTVLRILTAFRRASRSTFQLWANQTTSR